MPEQLVQLGILLMFVSVALIIIGSVASGSNVKFGVGGFIGPLPFGFSNDPRLLWAIIAIMIAFLLIFWLAPRSLPI